MASDHDRGTGSGGDREAIVLPPGGGREYEMGTMRAVFKADGPETSDRYSVSEWWLEPGEPGPGAHSHEANEELFYVIEGMMSFLVGEQWVEAPRGTFLRIPAGVTHDFANRSTARAGALNVFIPGGFEPMMPRIVAYFEEREAGSGGSPAGARLQSDQGDHKIDPAVRQRRGGDLR